MNQIERLIRAGFITVSTGLQGKFPRQTSNWTAQQQAALTDELQNCTAVDVNLFQSIETRSKTKAPVAYIHIYKNNWFSLGIFILFEGSRLPLHDHPGMFGALKTIYGKIRIQSYSVIESAGKQVKAYEENPIELDHSSPPAILQPNDKNIHEIEFVRSDKIGSCQYPYAAFIDFLSPPYRDDVSDDVCNYYEVLHFFTQNYVNGRLVTLNKCPAPRSYWTSEAPYIGLPIKNLIQQLEYEYPKSCSSNL